MRTFLPLLAIVVAVSACNRPGPGASSSGQSEVAAATPAQSAAPAEAPPAPPDAARAGNVLTGQIAETIDAGEYTYARVAGAGREVWVAAPRFAGGTGETVTVSLDMPMQNFESRTLNRTFPMLYFVESLGRDGQAGASSASGAPPLMPGHGAGAAPAMAAVEPVDLPDGGVRIADVFARRQALAGKPVVVRGRVVKFNGGILDRNWLHVQDGSGSAASHDNDLTITTSAQARVGDVVTMSGIVGLDKDFGAGYAYDVILEGASPVGR